MVGPAPAVFAGGRQGLWELLSQRVLCGQGLPTAPRLAMVEGRPGAEEPSRGVIWQLRGVRSYPRYTTHEEQQLLQKTQECLGRPLATLAALIPISKSDAWWKLAADRRRAIMEAQSRHISVGAKYLPGVARQLYHCRELGGPFDFITWFEFSPEHEAGFNELLDFLRRSEEWNYVEREVEIRLKRAA